MEERRGRALHLLAHKVEMKLGKEDRKNQLANFLTQMAKFKEEELFSVRQLLSDELNFYDL